MLRMAAFASSMVPSTATVLPLSNPAATSRCCTQVKTAHRQRVAGAPGDPAFRVDPFKVADQQQPEVPTRRQARPSHHRRVEPGALAFDKLVEVVGVQ